MNLKTRKIDIAPIREIEEALENIRREITFYISERRIGVIKMRLTDKDITAIKIYEINRNAEHKRLILFPAYFG